MMVILGGMGNFAGAIVGAFAFDTCCTGFKDLPTVGGSTRQALAAWMGMFIVLVVALRAARPARAAGSDAARRKDGRRMSEADALPRRELTKRFGGLAAVNDVSLDLVARPHPRGDRPQRRRQIDADQPALRRPAAESGSVTLDGSDVTRLAPERISRPGLGRSYQKTNIFLPFTVWENCRLAAQSRAAASHARWLAPAASARDGERTRASDALELGGPASRAREHVAGDASATASSASSKSP